MFFCLPAISPVDVRDLLVAGMFDAGAYQPQALLLDDLGRFQVGEEFVLDIRHHCFGHYGANLPRKLPLVLATASTLFVCIH